MSTPDSIKRLLDKRKENGRFRSLPKHAQGIDFYSNDYLGLAGNIELRASFLEFLNENKEEYLFGSTGSRLVSGNLPVFEEAEAIFSAFFKSENSLLFPSGFQANLALFSSLPQKNDLVVYDAEIHASIKSSLRQSNADLRSFKHNDLDDLKQKIRHQGGEVYLVVESVYSISGDLAPLAEIARFCTENSCRLIVDEAHSTGIYGLEGRGLCVEMNIQDLVFARIHTFGKAMGCAGAIIACSCELRDFLINFSIPFIYSTAMPPVQVYNMLFHLEYLRKNSHLISQLQSNILLFKNKAIEHEMQDRFSNFNHILNFNIGDDGLSVELMNNLCKNGFLVKAMLPPTVSDGASSLRIIMHSTNYIEEIDNLFLHVKKLF